MGAWQSVGPWCTWQALAASPEHPSASPAAVEGRAAQERWHGRSSPSSFEVPKALRKQLRFADVVSQPPGLCFLECSCICSQSPFPAPGAWHDTGFRASGSARVRQGSGRGDPEL